MSANQLNLFDALRARGVIPADAPALPDEESHRPWFVSLMLGIAGWLAGFFVLGFIAMSLEIRSNGAFFALGMILAAFAWVLYFVERKAVFLDQLALAISIAGQCAIGWALINDHSELYSAVVLLLLQLVVLVVMPNKTARTLAALFATIAWVYTIRFALRGDSFEELFETYETQRPRPGAWSLPVAWLVTWLPMVLAAGWLTLRENIWMASPLRVLARPGLTGLLIGLSLGGVITEPFATLAFGVQGLGVPVSWMVLFPLLSIALAMYAAWCAFRLRNNGLLGFAVFAALMHLARFYYLYGTSLMWKSAIMLCLGAVMLGIGFVYRERLAGGGET